MIAIFDHTVNWRFWLRRTATHFVRGVLQGDAARRRKLPIPLAYRRFFNGPDRRHFQIGIGHVPGMVGLEKAMAMAGMNENILLKIDIEGAEYEILDAIVVNRKSLVGCVIEFSLFADRKRTRLNSSHHCAPRQPSYALKITNNIIYN